VALYISTRSLSDNSEPPFSIRSTQAIEPHRSHLLEPRIIRVKSIIKVRRRIKSRKHIHDTNPLPSTHPRINNTLHLRVERLDVRLRVRIRARDDLRNHNRRLRPLGHDNVDQLAEARVRVFPAVRAAVVGAGVQEHDVGLDARVGDAGGCAGDLVDHPARVAFVVFVGHGAALHGADVVDFGAGGGQRGEEELAVAVAGRAADAVLLVRAIGSERCWSRVAGLVGFD
jgi:hypothetical protein